MIFNDKEIGILSLAMKILEIQSRFCRFGIMSSEEYMNSRTYIQEQPLVYNPETLDDDGMYTIYAGYGNSERYYENIYVRYFKGATKDEDFIEVAVPVVLNEDCQCYDCKEPSHYQLYLISRDGSIAEDIDADEYEHECDCDCHDECCSQECHENAKSAADIMRCRTTGAHDLCNCECGEEHCFVECGPDPEAECEFNEKGRCHCPHNRCCGCDCECEPDEE